MSCFTILNGRNGATYIVNLSSISTILSSLNFYQANSAKQRAIKLCIVLWLLVVRTVGKVLPLSLLINKLQVKQYLADLGCPNAYTITNTSSILLSPTRSKVIINQGDYFHKIAFGNSYHNVANELSVYQLLNTKQQCFAHSNAYDYFDNGLDCCSFKMSAQQHKLNPHFCIDDLVLPLVDLFRLSSHNQVSIGEVAKTLQTQLSNTPFKEVFKDNHLSTIVPCADTNVPSGLVHGDFKRWNMIASDPVFIFDFEEADFSGLPLEDLFNYIIDPIVRYQTPKQVAKQVFAKQNVAAYQRYLTALVINVEYIVLLYLYLLGRVAFWQRAGQVEAAIAYANLLIYIDSGEFTLYER